MKNFLTQGLWFVQSLYILFGSTARYYFHFNFNSFQMNITCSNYLDSKECTAIISHVTRHPLSWPDSSRILILKSEKENELWKKNSSLFLAEWLPLPTNGHKHILKRKKASVPSGHNLTGNNYMSSSSIIEETEKAGASFLPQHRPYLLASFFNHLYWQLAQQW